MILTKKMRSQDNGVFSIRRRFLKKGLSILPNLFTLGNAFFGFCSIILASRDQLFPAAYFIFLAALMDALDGRVARLVGASSDFGLQLDSLSDAISFCLSPAALVYFWHLKKMGSIGILISSFFLFAGILRLARFNLIAGTQMVFFLGLPTTIAGCFLVTVLLNTDFLVGNNIFLVVIVFLVLALAALMVSTVRFPTFKKKLFKLKFSKNWHVFLFILVLATVSVFQFNKVLLALFLMYFFYSVVEFIKFKINKNLDLQ